MTTHTEHHTNTTEYTDVQYRIMDRCRRCLIEGWLCHID